MDDINFERGSTASVVAALLGFGGVAGTAMEGAKLLFWVAIILAVVAAVVGLVRR